LSRIEVQVLEAEKGKEGIQKAIHEKVDVVLIDKMMPDIDGMEAIRRIREVKPTESLPILGFSSDISSEDEQAFFTAGANDIIPKPINFDQLVEMLCHVLKDQTGRENCRKLSHIGTKTPTKSEKYV